MYEFHISIHGLAADATAGEPLTSRGQSWPTLQMAAADMSLPLAVSFEEAVTALEDLGRPFVEPDGSFIWTSSSKEPERWQLDGVLYDRGGRLNHVDLSGTCPAERFDQMLQSLGWPAAKLMFQLSREAVFMDEATFRNWAAASASGR